MNIKLGTFLFYFTTTCLVILKWKMMLFSEGQAYSEKKNFEYPQYEWNLPLSIRKGKPGRKRILQGANENFK